MALVELTQFPLEKEYEKDTGITPEDIAELRRWLETQPHLPSKYITDLDLILVFHSCNCSTGVTKQVLDLHYTLRTLFTSYFKDRCYDDRIEKSLDIILPVPLPTRTKEGYAIFYTHLIDYDPKKFVLDDLFRCVLMVMDLWQYKEGTWPGIILIMDFEGMTLAHLARYDIQSLQQFTYFLQEAMFMKIKGLHYLNAPGFIDKFIAVTRPFMKKQLLDIFTIHMQGSDSIKEVLPLEALPKESGGNYKSYRECADDVKEMIKAGESYLRIENMKRVTESLRPGKPKTIADIFGGVEGSFKKLDID